MKKTKNRFWTWDFGLVQKFPHLFRRKPAGFFRLSFLQTQEFLGAHCTRWAQAVLDGKLDPLAPCVDSVGRLTSPLQFWGLLWAESHSRRAASPWNGQELIDALPALSKAGLPSDHMHADRSSLAAEPLQKRSGLWLPAKPKFEHMSSSQRPLLHILIGYDGRHGAGLAAVQSVLGVGASPSSRDAFGIPALALCAAHTDPDLGWELWRALVAAGADMHEPFVSSGDVMGGWVCMMTGSASAGFPITPREFALRPQSILGDRLRRQEAEDEANALGRAAHTPDVAMTPQPRRL